MRFFRKIKNWNWKYLFVELFLIFIGLYSALALNDWNSNRKANADRGKAIEKVKEELQKNKEELLELRLGENAFVNAMIDHEDYFSNGYSEIRMSLEKRAELLTEYPDFFNVIDSVKLNDDRYSYTGSFRISMDIPELSEIAWQTTQKSGISKSMNFDCLYLLGNIYSTQSTFQSKMDEIPTLVQQRAFGQMIILFKLVKLFEPQLLERYDEALNRIDDCDQE